MKLKNCQAPLFGFQGLKSEISLIINIIIFQILMNKLKKKKKTKYRYLVHDILILF